MSIIQSRGDKIFRFFNYTVLAFVGAICLFPFMNVLAKSLSSEGFVVSGQVWLLPRGFNIKAYRYILTNNSFWRSMGNSVYVTLAGTALNTMLTLFVAYTVSRKHVIGRSGILFLYIFTMMFSGGMIPTYLVVRQFQLVDKLEALYIPGLVSAFNLTIMRNYFATIPDSLEESARIDGAGNLRILFRIMIPLALPSIATISLFVMVGYWNDYLNPLIYITSTGKRTLQVFLRGIVNASKDVNMNDFDALNELSLETIRGATVFAATFPILLVYPFLQRYFVAGATVGAVKQ